MTTVFFEAWRGAYADSPARVSEVLGKRRPDVRRLWASSGAATFPAGVERVQRHSAAYFKDLAKADLLVTNDIMTRRLLPGRWTAYVQTWHGTPLKLLGYDERERAYDPAGAHWTKVRRDVGRWDYLVSPSPTCTDLLRSAFRYDGQVLETGYPRNDMLLAPEAPVLRETVRRSLGVEEQKVVLYLPTWRDDRSSIWDHPEVTHLAAHLPRDTLLWVRGHRNERRFAARPHVRDVSDHTEVGELYLAADVLVTDYSSAVYDFAVTRKPVVLFAPDLETYQAQRGFYFDYEQWAPGPVTRTGAQALDAVAESALDRSRYDAFVATFCPYEDGRSGSRLTEFLDERVLAGRS